MRQLIAAVARRIVSIAGTLEGYEQPKLVDEIFNKTKAYDPPDGWPEMIGVSSVLDFGGACGQHYKQARIHSPSVRWAVVETPAMVRRASELATDCLQFFTSISEARDWLGSVDVMHSGGALQYAPDQEETLNELCGLRAKAMHWNRTALSDNQKTRVNVLSLLGENGPGTVRHFTGKAIRYTLTKMPERTFLDAHREYALADRGADWFRFNLK